jgi:Carbohydrate-binding module family 5/12
MNIGRSGWRITAALIAIGVVGCSGEPITGTDEAASTIAGACWTASGPWTPQKAYAAGDLVDYQGTTYRCRQAHTAAVGWEPTATPALWVIPTPCDVGPWAPQTDYAVGSRVTFAGATYQCRQAHVSLAGWDPIAAPALWQLAAGGDPGDYHVWPNPVSRASSDPWIVAHHDQIEQLRPNVLVLLYANPGTADGERALVEQITRGLSEGSRSRGYADPAAPVQIDYQLTFVDLRDGVNGRPPPPAGYPYENSTLYPRKPAGAPGWGFDYARLFTSEYAPNLGYHDAGGGYRDLCSLVNDGTVHELWVVGSGDVPDANAAEVLGMTPYYTAQGERIPGAVNRCAGNGCFDPEVPFCGRTFRIGWVNYNRGPGCYMHNQGHGIEFGIKDSIPALRDWFVPFAGFDYDTHYGLPFNNLYAVTCTQPPCLAFPTPTHAHFTYGDTPYDVDPFDAVCGNVHFPPNGTAHYDYFNPTPVQSSCTGFGRHQGPGRSDALATVDPSLWSQYGQFGDCGGEFLTWWYQNMPGHGSGQTFADGRPMKSMWPFFYY